MVREAIINSDIRIDFCIAESVALDMDRDAMFAAEIASLIYCFVAGKGMPGGILSSRGMINITEDITVRNVRRLIVDDENDQ